MKIYGTYKHSSDRYLAIVPLLDLREVGKSKEELFDKLTKRINQTLINLSKKEDEENGDITIKEIRNSKLEINFSKPKLICALIIKSLRSIEKITQEKVASTAKIERVSYKQYEEARREPSVSKFNEIIEALGYEWLLTLRRKTKK